MTVNTIEQVVARIEAAPVPTGKRKRHGDLCVITTGPFAMSDHGPCVYTGIVGTRIAIKRTVDGRKVWYYGSNGVVLN